MEINDGKTLDVVLAADVAGGEMRKIGDIVGIFAAAGKTGEQVVMSIAGKHRVAKDTSVAIANGKKVYWKAATQVVTGSASGNDFIGYAAQVTATADAEIEIVLRSL